MKTILRRTAALLFALTLHSQSFATVRTVTIADAENVAGTLSGEIAAAAAGDTIVFHASIAGQPIIINNAEITIDKDLVILGNPNGNTVVTRATCCAISGILITGGVTVVMKNLNLFDFFSAGLRNVGSNVTLLNCAIRGCRTWGAGGAISSTQNGNLTLVGCLLSGNNASQTGGAIRMEGGTLMIRFSTIVQNTSSSSGIPGVVLVGDVDAIIYGSVICRNFRTGDLQDGPNLSGDIEQVLYSFVSGFSVDNIFASTNFSDWTDPLFVAPTNYGFVTSLDGDFRLQKNSPLIDVQTSVVGYGVTTDLDGNPRFLDGDGNFSVYPDAGAYEYVDSIPPQIVTVSNSLTQVYTKVPYQVSVRFSEEVTGFTADGIETRNCTVTTPVRDNSDRKIYRFMVHPIDEDTVSVTIMDGAVSDSNGNLLEQGDSPAYKIFDITSPILTISSNPADTVDGPFELTVLTDEYVIGFLANEVQLTNATMTDFPSVFGTSFPSTVTPISEGPITFTFNAGIVTDRAGNPNGAYSFSVYNRAPTPGPYEVAFDQAEVVEANQANVSFTYNAAEPGADYQWTISSSNGGTPVTGSGTIVTGIGQITGLNLSGLNDGTLTLSFTLTNAVNISSDPVTATVEKRLAETSVSLVDGVLVIRDINGGTSNDVLTLTDDGTLMYIHNTIPSFELIGEDLTLIDPNTVSVPLSSITDSIGIDGVGGTNTLNINLSNTLPGVNIGTANFRHIYQNNMLSTGSGNLDLVAKLVQVNGAIETTSGQIKLTGGTSASGLIGVLVSATGSISSTSGNIVLDGVNPGGNSSTAIHINGGSVASTDGNIAISGEVGMFSSGQAILIAGGTVLTSGSGSVTINGFHDYSCTKAAVEIRDNSSISVVNGNLSIRGEFDQENEFEALSRHGVYMKNEAGISSTGSGTVTITGIAGACYGDNTSVLNHGVFLEDDVTITSIQGDINIEGASSRNESGSVGIYIDLACEISSTGTGVNAADITLHGILTDPGTASGYAVRVPALPNFSTQSFLTSVDGDITVYTSSMVAGRKAMVEFRRLTSETVGDGSLTVRADEITVSNIVNGQDTIVNVAQDLEFVTDNLLSPSGKYASHGNIIIRPLTDAVNMRLGYSSLVGTLSMTQQSLNRFLIAEAGGEYTFGSPTAGNIFVNYTSNGGRPVNILGTGISVVSMVADGDTVRYTATAGGVIQEASGHVHTKAAVVEINGKLAPGGVGSAGLFKVEGNMTFSTGDILAIDLLASDNDSLQLLGTAPVLNLGNATLNLNAVGYTPSINDEFLLIDVAGTEAIVGTFNGIPEGGAIILNGEAFMVSYTGGDGNDVVLSYVSPVNMWTGTNSSDWNDAGNWSQGIPAPTDVVLIESSVPNQPVVTSDPPLPLTIGTITIESGATLTVAAGKALTITGTVDNSGTILLESDPTGTGTLITLGAVGGSGTFIAQQHLTGSGGGTPDGRHWYVAPTVSSTNSGAFSAAGDNRLWTHSETLEVTGANGAGWTEITDNATALSPMRGYLARLGATETVEYTGGTFNTGDLSLGGLTRTGTVGGKRGYQLVANPYPSFLNWDDAWGVSTDLMPTIWYRTEQSGSMVFATYNALLGEGVLGATRDIHPGQAFWVRVDADGNTGTLALDNTMRSHRDAETMRDGIDLIRLTLTNGTQTDEAMVFFNDLADNGADIYDSEKQMAPAEVPQLWSNVDGARMAINGINSPETQPTVPLGIRVQTAGEYTITATELDLPVGAWLEDITTGAFQSLDSEPSYAFSSEGGTFQSRFVLHFSAQVVGLDEMASGIDIFSFEKNINIILSEETRGVATVMDMAGRVITTSALQGQRTTIPLNVSAGIYVVRVETEKGVETRRVLIN
jgi:hypothetical protein